MNQVMRADRGDAEEILELQKLAYQSEAILYNDWSIPPLTQTLDEIREDFARTAFLKLCDSARIVGSVRVATSSGNCQIGRLVVHPDFQGRGVGTRLLLAVEAEFPTSRRFELFTGSKSVRNIRLYERLGYRIVTRKRVTELLEIVFLEKYRR